MSWRWWEEEIIYASKMECKSLMIYVFCTKRRETCNEIEHLTDILTTKILIIKSLCSS